MRILSVGWFRKESNTSLHRHMALKKNAVYIDKVDASTSAVNLWYHITYHLFHLGIPIRLPDLAKANQKIRALTAQNKYDVIWIDKGITINRATLLSIKRRWPLTQIVSYSPDNMALRHNQSQNYLECLRFYDYIFTTKSHSVEKLYELGANQVNFIHKTYGEDFHFPRELTSDDILEFGAEVGFVGTWERERFESILFLANNGIKVRVFGDAGWQKYRDASPNLSINEGLFNEDYPKALQAFDISLCFLRKINSDQQTARTMEITACGGFMLAERTQEHLNLFEEDKEAVFFSSNEELLDKCKYYLSNKERRREIALAGLERCKTSGYSNMETVKKMLHKVLKYEDVK